MPTRWLDRDGDEQAVRGAADFWAALRQDVDAGTFWADRIKAYRDAPAQRLELALGHLPLPAAFQEAAVAVRAIIRARRKAGEPWHEPLSLLYWLAAIASFLIPYAPRLQEPGFNVLESIPGRRVRSLPFEYRQLGYTQLGLLTATDRKWLVEAWGEPAAHRTLHAIHRALWDEYEDKLLKRRQAERAKFAPPPPPWSQPG